MLFYPLIALHKLLEKLHICKSIEYLSVEMSANVHDIVILGGSYAGQCVMRSLLTLKRDNLRITLVDANDYFEGTTMILRGLVDEKFHEKIIFSYESILETWNIKEKVVFVQGRATEIDNSTSILHLDNGTQLKYDCLIVATGASYAVPVRDSRQTTKEGRVNQVKEFISKITEASHIVIGGGGVVGVELAGEIAEVFASGKKITLINRANRLLNRYPEGVGKYAAQQLTKMGVDVVLNTTIDEYFAQSDAPSRESVLFFETVGPRMVPDYMKSDELRACVTKQGQIKINDYLQVCNVETQQPVDKIFCLGDACFTGHIEEEKSVVTIYQCISPLITNVVASLKSAGINASMPTVFNALICISIGSKDAIMLVNDCFAMAGSRASTVKEDIIKSSIEGMTKPMEVILANDRRGRTMSSALGWTSYLFWFFSFSSYARRKRLNAGQK